jgi:dTDP-4-amino-4,6-dideoxygalactose transaminase
MDDLARAWRRLSGRYVPYLQPYWDDEDFFAVRTWLKSGAIDDARAKLTDTIKSRFPQSAKIVLTDTGKSALYVALKMLGIGPGDEVVIPSFCCASVLASAVRAGCTPVLADCDEHFNISAESAAAALSSRTKAIVVPHLYGLKAAALQAIVALARQRGIAVVEDVAQAYGLQLENGVLAGSLGDAAIFSAGLGKPLMGPGGGWAIINRPGGVRPDLAAEPLAEGRRRVANFIARFTGPHWRRGGAEIAHALPARLTARARRQESFSLSSWAERECRAREISAIDAWLAARQIDRIDGSIARRRDNARRWRDLLGQAKVPCATPPDEANTHAIFPLLFDGTLADRTAEKFRRGLERGGVATEPCYTPLHLRAEGRALRRTNMSCCESAWRRVFAVPARPNLLPEDWDRIESVVAQASSSLALS